MQPFFLKFYFSSYVSLVLGLILALTSNIKLLDSSMVNSLKGTAWENKKLCLFALIIGVKEHPAYGGWPRPCRCLHVIAGPFGPAKDMLWTIRVPEEQISCCKCCPGFWFFFKNFFFQFLEMRVCVSVMKAFFLNMKFVLNK